MKTFSRSLALAALAATTLSVGCGASKPRQAGSDARIDDDWAGIPHSAEWVFLAHATPNNHKAECKEMLDWVEGEEKWVQIPHCHTFPHA